MNSNETRTYKRWITATTVAATLFLVGCGTSATTTSNSTTTGNTPAQSVSQTGFHNMSALQTALTTQSLQNPSGSTSTTPQPTSANCIQSGTSQAQCSVSMPNGSTGVLTITISADGMSFLVSNVVTGG
jgi:hypothetical protein